VTQRPDALTRRLALQGALLTGKMTRREFLNLAMTTGAVAGASLSGILAFSAAGCANNRAAGSGQRVLTTLDQTISFDRNISGLQDFELSQVSQYARWGYGVWRPGPGLPSDLRTDIMPAGYAAASAVQKVKLLNFFAITDIHITDKENPSQLIYLQQNPDVPPPPYDVLGPHPWAFESSVYSPVMLYTTHVLDAAVRAINGLHQQNPFDFGISLGDVCNSTLYNETRWYIDVLDGKLITPSSGAHLGAGSIDYQKPFQAAGLDKTIPWYQALGNHDHFWMGGMPLTAFLQQSLIGDAILAAGDVLDVFNNIDTPPLYYMGVLDGSTPLGNIIGAGPVATFASAPQVAADPNRRSLSRTEWIAEFFTTSSNPAGHGFNLVDPTQPAGFACYSFMPKANVPLKVLVLDDTQLETDGSTDIHGHGFLDAARWAWLQSELAAGDAAGQLMIIAAHVPIGVGAGEMGWWNEPANPVKNACTLPELLAALESHPNLLMWIAGHRHMNVVKAFVSTDSAHPENGFWHVETSSLRDYPQQLRTFEIFLNSDYTVSIVTTNVDTFAPDGTPAATSRTYAVATQQIVANDLSPNVPGADPTIPQPDPADPTVPDPTVKSIAPTYSYNATLYKQLSPQMVGTLKTLYPAL